MQATDQCFWSGRLQDLGTLTCCSRFACTVNGLVQRKCSNGRAISAFSAGSTSPCCNFEINLQATISETRAKPTTSQHPVWSSSLLLSSHPQPVTGPWICCCFTVQSCASLVSAVIILRHTGISSAFQPALLCACFMYIQQVFCQ